VNRARLPRPAVTAWLVALAVLVVLGFAVAHYWSGSSGDGHAGMAMGPADALTRGGSGSPLSPLFGSALFTAWQLDAIAVAVLVLVAAWYLTGVALVPVRTPGQRWPRRHTMAFLAGLAVCAFATNGSIAVYDQVLFTAHMAGHLALVMVAPALLVAGRPLSLLLAASTPTGRDRWERVLRGRVVALLTAPPLALATYTAVIVGSHLTGLMDTIMRNTWAGQLEHLVYVLAGCQFFVLAIGAEPIRWRLGSPARWLLLAIAMAVDTFTGIVLIQGSSAVHLSPSDLKVNALSDTHTGGAIMWVGGDGIMLAIMVALVAAWLRDVDTRPAEHGWLEQARSAAFESHTGASEATGAAIDDDDEARAAYNQWLRELDARGR
jgi:putative copper resistance protein D